MTTDADSRLERIEKKVDGLHEAMVLLARIDERLVAQKDEARRTGERLGELERRVDKLEVTRAKTAGIITGLSFIGYVAGPYLSKLLEVANGS